VVFRGSKPGFGKKGDQIGLVGPLGKLDFGKEMAISSPQGKPLTKPRDLVLAQKNFFWVWNWGKGPREVLGKEHGRFWLRETDFLQDLLEDVGFLLKRWEGSVEIFPGGVGKFGGGNNIFYRRVCETEGIFGP